MTSMSLLLLFALLVSDAGAWNEVDDSREVVNVPTGLTTVLLNGQVVQDVDCWVLADTSPPIVELKLTDANGTRVDTLVAPRTLAFAPVAASSAALGELQKRSFTLFGREAGRFYLAYTLAGNNTHINYRLSAKSSVVSVAAGYEQDWQGVWYQLAFNGVVFLVGLIFFAWRRIHKVELPIWKGHQETLFEHANYDDLSPEVFTAKYGELHGTTLWERAKKFGAMSCTGDYVCTRCGIPAALLLRFHLDTAHMFAILSVFSLAAMLPVNYWLDNSRRPNENDTYQETTFSNVPLYSEWFWAHVAYCYLVAFAVLTLLRRQHDLSSTLRRRTKRIVGARSVFIQRGLAPDTTSKSLRAALRTVIPRESAVHEVTVLQDLSKVHELLARREELADELSRIQALDEAYEEGTMSWNLLCCPGSVMVPHPLEVLLWHLRCKPCRYALRHGKVSECCCYCCTCCCPKHSPKSKKAHGFDQVRRGSSTKYESLSDDTAGLDESSLSLLDEMNVTDLAAAHRIHALLEELDFFPEDALDEYAKRRCVGAAFVIFDSTATRNAFVRIVRGQSVLGRIRNGAEALASRGLRDELGASSLLTSRICAAPSENIVPELKNLSLRSAPEPDDVIWRNLEYQPYSLRRALAFLARQLATVALLLLFSTPTAVLVYVKLDSSSVVYRGLDKQGTVLLTLLASYLPSLLLIAVNWCLLAFLYHLSMSERSVSESHRIKSFLVKGFIYLVVSSVLLPSIGVTAAYLALSDLSKSGGRSYVESFLYKVSGTFFISYVCQRAFLGAIVDLTRSADLVAYQPWVLSRSVTPQEIQQALRPRAFAYGHDYALVLSIFVVVLLGTVITPVITPFGALFFYLKFATTKYNVLYVLPYSPGRGHIAHTSYTLIFGSLLLFEVVMGFVFLQVAGRKHFTAMIVLLVVTCAVYLSRLSGMEALALVQQGLADLRRDSATVAYDVEAFKPAPRSASRRTVLGPTPTDLEQDAGLVATYADPYKAALSIFKLLGVNQFHQMTSTRTQVRYAFIRLRRHAQAPIENEKPKKRRWWHRWSKKKKKANTT